MNAKRSQLFLCIVTAILLIILVIFAWNFIQRKPFDLMMYGAEIKPDGTILTETSFLLNGYLIDDSNSGPLSPWIIHFKPILFENISDFSLDMESYDGELLLWLSGSADDPNYYTNLFCYSEKSNVFEIAQFYWSGDFSCCMIEFEGRWFVGSTDPEMEIQQILEVFPEVEIESVVTTY